MPSILLVEDDQTIRITVEFALTKAGYAVTTATDGEAALECAYKVNPDLILLDLMLPRLSGGSRWPATCARTTTRRRSSALTALDREEDKIRGLDAGADD